MNKITAILKLTRIEHSVLLIIAVIAAELIVGGIPIPYIFALSLITPALVSAGAFAINDYFDVKTDIANKKTDRPIVAKAITPKGAFNVAMVCFVLGVLSSALINAYSFLIALIFAVLAFLYSYRLKDTVLWGNSYVAFTGVIPFIFGNFVVSAQLSAPILLISFVAFLASLAREIHGTIRDRIGDVKVRGSKNLVYYIGARKASEVALILYVESIVISLFLFAVIMPFQFNLIYIVPVGIADFMFLYVAVGHLIKNDNKFYSRARNLSLAAMALAVLAYLLSAIAYVPV